MPITDRVATDIPVTIKTVSYTLRDSDWGRELQFDAASTVTATLPDVSTAGDGYNFVIRNMGVGDVTVQPQPGQLIDGASSLTLTTDKWRWFRSDGTEWKPVGTSDKTLADGSVTTAKLADGAVTEPKIATGAVTNSKLGADAVTADKILDGVIGTAELANNAVTADKILDGAVGSAEIATDAVGADEIAAGAVGSAELATDSVTSAKIAAGAVDSAELAADSVTEGKIAVGAVDTAELADDAVTLAKMASGTAGNVITYDASGNPVAVATGTADQVLTSNGAGAAPTFQAAGSGAGLVLLETETASTSATLDFTAFDNATYSAYMLTFDNLRPASNSAMWLRFSDDGGTTYETTFYDWGLKEISYVGTGTDLGQNATSQIIIANDISSLNTGMSGHVWIHGAGDSADTLAFPQTGAVPSAGGVEWWSGGGIHTPDTVVDACRILASTGNLTSGTVRLYGVVK